MREISNSRIEAKEFNAVREEALGSWSTGAKISIEDGVKYHLALPESKIFAKAIKAADDERRVLLQPRAGVALVDEHIRTLKFLEQDCDLLPTTIDSYTRQNRYEEAQKGIEKSLLAGRSLLNGFPAVNHGISECRRVVESVEKPVEIRHGTPDARLLAELTIAAGFTSFEGGGISYNIPYAKKVPLERSIYDWQYVDRLAGIYQDEGVTINREPFGPLSGTLIPPFISHVIGIIEGLLALAQGVKSITLGYGQAGNLVQDVAAIHTLKELADKYFRGYCDYEVTTAFHQWMGGFPENESRAMAVISLGGAAAALAGAGKIITKTPHEALGVPTMEANLQGLQVTRQIVNMLSDQQSALSGAFEQEKDLIRREVDCVMQKVLEIGGGDVAAGTVKAFANGFIDVPFAPSMLNNGKLLPCRDNEGAIRIFDPGAVPMEDEILCFHRDKIAERAKAENRSPCYQMVMDDIYAISKGKLVGRPRSIHS